MAYLEAHQTLINHPKTKKAARLLGVSRPAIIGHLFMLWSWCMDYAQDGDVTDVDWQDVAEAIDWQGDAEVFKAALITASVRPDAHGFLEQTADGRLVIHDWHDYAGKLIAIRIKDAERKRAIRGKDVQGMSDGRPADVQGMSDVAKQSKANPTQAKQSLANGRAIQSASDMEDIDRTFEIDEATMMALRAGYTSEEISSVIALVSRRGTKVGKWSSYMLKTLKSSREQVDSARAIAATDTFVPNYINPERRPL